MEKTNAALSAAAQLLDAHPDFKVIRRILPRSQFSAHEGRALSRGIVIDTETTGIDPDKDVIIELGMVLFEYDPETGAAFRVLATFDQLEDPGFSIPPESIAVHGITDEMVAGKRIDDAGVTAFLESVSLVIAHNAKFDRVFLEKRLPVFESQSWGCSFAQVDWSGEGLGSAKLDYIAYQYGFFYEAHRADTDCYALLEILQQPLPKSGELVLASLLNQLDQNNYQIYAVGSPFETKDILKSRGYRWNGDKKCWHTSVVGEEAREGEVDWLKCHVYGNKKARVEIETHNALTRFSNRAGERTIREI